MSELSLDLIEDIRKTYDRLVGTSTTIRALSRKINNQTATYQDAYRYAKEIGNIRKKALKNTISSEKLPDGRMYYNIAKDIVNDSLKTDYKAVNNYCKVAQKNKNLELGIGIDAIEEEIDQDNIDSIIDAVSASENYDDKAVMFGIMCASFARNVVDRNMYKNASTQYRIGLKIVLVRTGGADCCDWCSGLTGSWPIEQAPDEATARHDNCTCSLDYEKRNH